MHRQIKTQLLWLEIYILMTITLYSKENIAKYLDQSHIHWWLLQVGKREKLRNIYTVSYLNRISGRNILQETPFLVSSLVGTVHKTALPKILEIVTYQYDIPSMIRSFINAEIVNDRKHFLYSVVWSLSLNQPNPVLPVLYL